MRKLSLLLFIVLLQSCVGGYTKLNLASVEQIKIESISLVSADFVASATLINSSGRDLKVRGMEVSVEQVQGLSLAIDTTVVIPKGMNTIDIPARLSYSPMLLLQLLGRGNEEFSLKIAMKLPGSEVKFKKKIKGADLLGFVKRISK